MATLRPWIGGSASSAATLTLRARPIAAFYKRYGHRTERTRRLAPPRKRNFGPIAATSPRLAANDHTGFAPLTKAAGSFLDIGCGLGEAVRTFASHGWDAEGIDADQSTAPVHREIGIRARIGQLEDFEVDKTYDMIHCAHAIYFITDPMRFLRMVRERLAPAGIFCVVIADFLSEFVTGPCLDMYTRSFRRTVRCGLPLRSPASTLS